MTTGTIPALVIAGMSSGVGKTTVTLAILEALRRRGRVVQAFKVGPDFIDPGFHSIATGRPAHTLDSWMCGRDHVTATVAREAWDADLAVIEGVMGCFDGLSATSETGSTAEAAKWLGAPVILVVDAAAMARSAGAVVLGFERFDPALEVAGVVFNRVGHPVHRRWLEEAVVGACRARPLGALPADPAAAIPERHLGLVTAPEGCYTPAVRDRLAQLAAAHLDLDGLISLARSSVRRETFSPLAKDPSRSLARIGVARDLAFQFYYADNLTRLESAGARLVEWSPLGDRSLPDVDGLYLGGGYPEVHARELSENRSVLRAVRKFAESGRPVYAECGGLMFLADSVEDEAGRAWPMVGLLPLSVHLPPGHLVLGYREVETIAPSLLGDVGIRARGHEFHRAAADEPSRPVERVYTVADPDSERRRSEGYRIGATLMSWVHLHFASAPAMARSFVEACGRARP
jgi:cobyrinic acid a,c-diamide synthase